MLPIINALSLRSKEGYSRNIKLLWSSFKTKYLIRSFSTLLMKRWPWQQQNTFAVWVSGSSYLQAWVLKPVQWPFNFFDPCNSFPYGCVGVWDKILEPVASVRKESEMLQLFPGYLKGEDLFGLTVSAVARIAESVSLHHHSSCWITQNCWLSHTHMRKGAGGSVDNETSRYVPWPVNYLAFLFCLCLFFCSFQGLRPVRITLSAMAETP